MLDVAIGIMLANISSQNAKQRGKNPYLFFIITIILFIIFEFIGVYFVIYILKIKSILATLITAFFAGMGGLLGVIISNIGSKNDDTSITKDSSMLFEENKEISSVQEKSKNLDNAELRIPCKIIIKREKAFYACAMTYNIKLNGKNIGFLKNGDSIECSTMLVNNMITSSATNGAVDTINFSIDDFTRVVEVYFKGQKFLKDKLSKNRRMI